MRRIFALITAVVVGLTGCGSTSDDKRGDPGRVTGRDSAHWTTRSGKTTIHHSDYDLTIERTKDGTRYELDVTGEGYDHCYRNSKYPKCVDN